MVEVEDVGTREIVQPIQSPSPTQPVSASNGAHQTGPSPIVLKRRQFQDQDDTEAGQNNKKIRLSPDAVSAPASERKGMNEVTQVNAEESLGAEENSMDTTCTSAPAGQPKSTVTGSQQPDTTVQTASVRKRKASDAADERKRGRRLFGAVFGALGQSTAPGAGGGAARRRQRQTREGLEDVKASGLTAAERAQRIAEARRERARLAAEDEVARETRLAELTRARRHEQSRFDRRSMRIRHDNARAAAHSLRTDTEPRLYYRPWKLRPSEHDTVDAQIKEVEGNIAREVRELDDIKQDALAQRHNQHEDKRQESDRTEMEDVRQEDVNTAAAAGAVIAPLGDESLDSNRHYEDLQDEKRPIQDAETTSVERLNTAVTVDTQTSVGGEKVRQQDGAGPKTAATTTATAANAADTIHADKAEIEEKDERADLNLATEPAVVTMTTATVTTKENDNNNANDSGDEGEGGVEGDDAVIY